MVETAAHLNDHVFPRLPVPLDPARRDDDVRIRMVHRAIAFVHALRLQLRDQRGARWWLRNISHAHLCCLCRVIDQA